jgi:hypothetical protein
MSDQTTQTTRINLIRIDDGRWRVFVNDEDMGVAYQFPWDALQCALNGSLTGRPIQNLQAIEVRTTTATDDPRLERIRASQEEQRALLNTLRGIDGEGI